MMNIALQVSFEMNEVLKSRGREDDNYGCQDSCRRCPRIPLFHVGQGFLQGVSGLVNRRYKNLLLKVSVDACYLNQLDDRSFEVVHLTGKVDDLEGPIVKLIQITSIDANLKQEIFITTVDKARNSLKEALANVEQRNAWAAPAGILATIVVVFPTAAFQDFIISK